MIPRLMVLGDDREIVVRCAEGLGLDVVRRGGDVVLCHGGDGTLLRAEREWPGVPKLPVRVATRARLCAEHQLDAVLARLAAGTLRLEELPLIEAAIGRLVQRAINDVVVRNDSPATAVRLRVAADGERTGEVTGDGVVVATPFGSSGYYRSITGERFESGLALAFNNTTERHGPIRLAAEGAIEIEVVRGPALLVLDNDPRHVTLREGHRVRLFRSGDSARAIGLDALRCQLCRKGDGSPFNPH